MIYLHLNIFSVNCLYYIIVFSPLSNEYGPMKYSAHQENAPRDDDERSSTHPCAQHPAIETGSTNAMAGGGGSLP